MANNVNRFDSDLLNLLRSLPLSRSNQMANVTEKQTHALVCQYLRIRNVMFNTDMSGINLPIGLAVQSAKLRSNTGYPDLTIYEPRGGWFALFIELKRPSKSPYLKSGKLSTNKKVQEQNRVHLDLIERGYLALFATGFDEAKRIIDAYLDGQIERIEL